MDMKTVSNNRVPAYYHFINNNSEETIVFVHGIYSSSSIFRHFLRFIKKNVLLVELRGIVYSSCKKPYIDNYVEDIHLMFKKEGIKGNAIIVGYSLGCSIVNAFADKYPSKVKKVIMLSPVNKTIREIGMKRFFKDLKSSLGSRFLNTWHEVAIKKNPFGIPSTVKTFNLKLMRDTYKTIDITKKVKIVIINGSEDSYFNKKDPTLELSNVMVEPLEKLDHFIFSSKNGIEKVLPALAKHGALDFA